MFGIFTLPSNFVASTTAIMGELFTDLAPYLTLIIGVVVAVLVIEIIIGALRK